MFARHKAVICIEMCAVFGVAVCAKREVNLHFSHLLSPKGGVMNSHRSAPVEVRLHMHMNCSRLTFMHSELS